MILVDTSVIVAWIDPNHSEHQKCWRAVREAAGRDQLAVSAVTYAELAAGARTREAVDEALRGFHFMPLDSDAAWRAGVAFRQYQRRDEDKPVLPDFFIRAQAATKNLPHLTNDRRRRIQWPDVDFIFPS
jgi:predicted nucleic acid-binding protein